MPNIILSGAARRRVIQRLSAVAIAIALAGCAGAVASSYYYTWQCPGGSCRALRTDTAECVTESNRPYSPWIAGPAPRGYFKSCLEARGYRKVGQSETAPAGAPAPGTGVTRYGWGP
jgi:hypothetical protein